MRLPLRDGNDSGDIDVEQANAMLDMAFEGGVNYFDTAYPYHKGESETFLGSALSRRPRDSFNLATKLPVWLVESGGDVDRLFAEQLEKCRVEYFDYYLVHSLNEARLETVRRYDVYERLRQKQEQGQIRRLGCSFHDRPELLEKVVGSYGWDFVQIQFNYLDWELQDARGQYLLLKKRGIPLVVMEPVRGGMLARLSEGSVRILKEAGPDASPASWALRYAASFPEVLTVLSGMSDMSQMKENIDTFSGFRPLSPYETEVLGSALSAFRASSTIPCTACSYCMDCPAGVDIPKVLATYNNYCVKEQGPAFRLEYAVLGESRQACNCVSCGQCVTRCPQKIDIPGWMARVDALHRELMSA
jgi:predicted aldo/keto reductase-like oxidoreductase